ncbi:MAG TPA: sugar porter family MFS transporter [Acidobacteriota bacterium]|nr:sugar porter family MFS transporter [Acidobacteriota bacterium]HRV07747.1 sugar porter family MFS transporter [Acidobacteriota bacterium]
MVSFLIRSTLVAALGGLLFGFDTAVISGTTDWLRGVFGLSSAGLGFSVAAALIGTIVGALSAGRPADRWGRRRTLFFIAGLYFVSALGTAFAWDWYSFLFFRFVGGIGVGGASVVSPMYIAEISPAQYRGRLVAVTQFNIVLGILLAFFSNYLIAGLDLGPAEWRWMFGVEAVPAGLFFLLLFLTPYSPRWLVMQGRIDEARKTLLRLGTDVASVEDQIREIESSIDLEHHSLREPLFQTKYRKPILLAVAIAAFNQLSGINAVMYYAPYIFELAGAGTESALAQTVAVGGTNLIFTLAAMAVIDYFGRRKLMLVGSVGYIVSLSTTAWAFYTYGTQFDQTGSRIVLISLLLFIASHAFGQGAVIWVFISEIFPTRVRARGQALGSFTHWFMAALISWTFPVIADASGGHAFAFYAAMMVLQLLWVIYVMPETKGVPLERIQKELGID